MLAGMVCGICLAIAPVTGVFAKANSAEEYEQASSAELFAGTKAVKLDADKVGETSIYNDIIYCPEKNGMYFIHTTGTVYSNSKQYEIVYYNLSSQTYTTVYNSGLYIEEAYIDNNAAYFAKSEPKRFYAEGSNTASYTSDITINSYNYKTGQIKELTLETVEMQAYRSNLLSAIGVDENGRYYVATYENILYLFSPEGKLLSQTEYDGDIYEFAGFDKTNGNFYYRGEESWVSWGYDHSMASLKAGKVGKDNSLKVKNGNMMYLYQLGWFAHKTPVKMLNGRYLAALSTFNGEVCVLLDSNQYDINDVTKSSTSISLTDSSVSVSTINIANKKAIKVGFYTSASKYGNGDIDLSSNGPRCVINDAGTSVIVKTADQILSEYDVNTKKEKIWLQTAYPVYTFFMKGNKVVVVEKKDKDYYLETFDWIYPKTFQIAAPTSMKVGASGTIGCTAAGGFKMDYTYKSSDPKIVSVDQNGNLNAWKKGTATITISAATINVRKTITIQVSASALSKRSKSYQSKNAVGTASATMHQSINSGSTNYGKVQTAYLNAKADGTFERVECIRDYVVCEIYDSSYRLTSQKRIKCELPLFGGYYCGAKYNYLVFGQLNAKDSKKKEVIRVVKYDKKWKKLGVCQIKGANTSTPFDAGGLDMTETAGKLYIHTCHEMFRSDDGYNHQANCTFVINERTMKLVDSWYDVMNLSFGYVSHSFAQQIATDGKYVYRADLGDGYPRGIALTVTPVGYPINRPVIYGTLVSIPDPVGANFNYTGYTLNDLKLGTNYYILTGTGIKNQKTETRNVYINAGLKTRPQAGTVWITNYTAKDQITVKNPKLVKLSGTQFLLMWEEQNTKKNSYTTKMVLLDEAGNKTSDIYASPLALAMCEPVVTKSGTVVWYVTNNEAPVFVEINPYQLSKVQTKTKRVTTFKNDQTYSFDNSKQSGYQKGDVVIKNKMIYKITSSKTVAFGGVTSNAITTVSIPKTVKLGKKTYKVTAVASRAFVNRSKLKKVTIEANVTKIGSYAFYGCKNLKSITIKTTKLKSSSIKSKAFTKIHSKATIKVPKGKKKAYKKILLKNGVTKKMKIK